MPGALSEPDTLIGRARTARLSAVSRRTRNIVLAVVALVILVWIVGYTLFNMGETVPGYGEGEVITTP
jgi:hypothetical protein